MGRKLKALQEWIKPHEFAKITFVYEPVWKLYSDWQCSGPWDHKAIAMQGMSQIRTWIKAKVNEETAKKVRILYGGPVTKEEAE